MHFSRISRAIRLRSSGPDAAGFESSRYLLKWLLLGVSIGAVAGLGAVLFSRAISLATRLLLVDLAGYHPPLPVGEGSSALSGIGHPWVLPFVVALGGLASGVIVYLFAPEAKGHGTDAAIAAIHHKGGRLRARVPPIKLVASAITIGSGGSAGREGPAAQISAGFGSFLAEKLKLSVNDRRIAVAAGMGAGIGAIFRAPLGGALMAAEILYLHDLEVEALVPGLIASIVGYSVYGAIEGWTPIFGTQSGLTFEHPLSLGYYAVLGIICGLGGLLYAKTFYSIEHVFDRLRLPVWLKPAIGGLLVGLMGLKVHGALHTGYGWVQNGMTLELLTLPLWIVLVLPFAKMLATAFSIGSGGSGGIFGPGMVIGGMFGAAFWRLGHGALPQLPDSPAPFVIVGMMALFGGIAHAPLAVMLMVAEMTGNLSLLAPAMVAVALSTALVGDHTIYTSQLPNRASSPAHRRRFAFPLLSSLYVRDAVRVGSNGHLPSSVPGSVAIPASEPLDNAIEQIMESGVPEADVTDNGVVIGSVSVRDIVATYRAALVRNTRRISALPTSSMLIEGRVDLNSPVAYKALSAIAFPNRTLVISISREGLTIFPQASTRLEPNDDVTFLIEPARETEIARLLGGNGADRPGK